MATYYVLRDNIHHLRKDLSLGTPPHANDLKESLQNINSDDPFSLSPHARARRNKTKTECETRYLLPGRSTTTL